MLRVLMQKEVEICAPHLPLCLILVWAKLAKSLPSPIDYICLFGFCPLALMQVPTTEMSI